MPQLLNTSLFNDANLVAYYKAEDVNDSKGSNNLINNGAVGFSAAKFNNGFDFGTPNTTKYLSGAYTYVATGNDFTVCWWFKTDDKSTVSFKSDVGGGGADEYYLIANVTGTISFHSCNSDGSESDEGGSVTAFDNSAWHHIAFVGMNSGTDWIKKIYFDSVLVSTNTVVGKDPGKLGDINIGRIIVEQSNFSTGLMDDVAIFSRALTATEINTLFSDLFKNSKFINQAVNRSNYY